MVKIVFSVSGLQMISKLDKIHLIQILLFYLIEKNILNNIMLEKAEKNK
jgi:hypothetical protein